MTAGVAPIQADLLKGTAAFCDGRVGEDSIWSVLHREGHRLFPDELFADVFADTGRRSVPPSIVATVMVLQVDVPPSGVEAGIHHRGGPPGDLRRDLPKSS